jgi:hypothetical protein
MDGKDDVWFGTVQYRFDWGNCEGSTIHPSTDQNEVTRLVRLGTLPRTGESGRMPRQSFRAGEEILVRYSEGSSQRGGGSPTPPTLLPTNTGNARGRPNPELTPPDTAAGQPVTKSYKKKRPLEASGATCDEMTSQGATDEVTNQTAEMACSGTSKGCGGGSSRGLGLRECGQLRGKLGIGRE